MKSAEVQEALRPYIVVVYDIDRGEGPEAAMRYGVESLPTMLLVGPDGESVNRLEGVPEGGSEQLADWLKNGVTQALPTDALEKRVHDVPDDAVALLGLAGRYKKDKRDADSAAMLRRAAAADAKNDKGVGAEATWNLGLIECNGKNGGIWYEFLVKFVRDFTRAPRAQMALDWLTAMPEVKAQNSLALPSLSAFHDANAGQTSRLRRLVYAAARVRADDIAITAARELVAAEKSGQSKGDLAACLAATGKRGEAEAVCKEALAGAAGNERELIEKRLADIHDGKDPAELAAVRAPWTPKKK